MSPFHPLYDEAHSWCVALDASPEAVAALKETLTDEERDRSARFRFERDRRRFVVAHGVLRRLLGNYLGTSPGRVRLTSGASGKPELSPEPGVRLRFNLSHSADLAVIAVALDADIGVDVEFIRPSPEFTEIARHYFSAAEVRQLSGLPGHLHDEAFLRYWTRKEAYVKARGDGLGIPLADLSVPELPEEWSFHTLRPAPGYVGALAVERRSCRLSQWSWRF